MVLVYFLYFLKYFIYSQLNYAMWSIRKMKKQFERSQLMQKWLIGMIQNSNIVQILFVKFFIYL